MTVHKFISNQLHSFMAEGFSKVILGDREIRNSQFLKKKSSGAVFISDN
jgi:hypothetical protein